LNLSNLFCEFGKNIHLLNDPYQIYRLKISN